MADVDSLTYNNFELVVSAAEEADGENIFQLYYTPPLSKTSTTKDAVVPLRETPERWRCPVAQLLTLAALDDILPYPVEEMRGKAFLKGHPERTVVFVKGKDLAVLRNKHGKPYTTSSLQGWLARLSRAVRFPGPLRIHAFRQLLAMWMSMKGSPVANIAMQLGHSMLQSSVTEGYTKMSPAVDLQAAVEGKEENHVLETLVLHPHVLKTNPRAVVALSVLDRMEVLQTPELLEPRDNVQRRRRRATEKFGSQAEWPEEVLMGCVER